MIAATPLVPIPMHGGAYQGSRAHGDKTEFGVCLDSRNYERCCAPREFLAHNREEIVPVC